MISVILSTYNEIPYNCIGDVLASVQKQDAPYELIIVDGGSTDGTCGVFPKNAQVFHTPGTTKSQRIQIGISHARGDVLFFLHSKSILPENIFSQIEYSLRDDTVLWGGMSHSFDSDHYLLRWTSWYSNIIRAKMRSIVYHDHCIFARAEIVHSIGGWPQIDIFEDTQFSYSLRKIAPALILSDKVITSHRRYAKRGFWKQSLINQWIKILFFFHAPLGYIFRMYEGKERT